MRPERFFQKLADYQKGVARLQEALALPESDLVRDALIQRFEFCYEMAWKLMKLWLEHKQIEVRNPKDTFREALQQNLILDGSAWSNLHALRNLTTHTYDEKTAVEVVSFVRDRGIYLLVALEKKLCESL